VARAPSAAAVKPGCQALAATALGHPWMPTGSSSTRGGRQRAAVCSNRSLTDLLVAVAAPLGQGLVSGGQGMGEMGGRWEHQVGVHGR
jgi:hypothetical protein